MARFNAFDEHCDASAILILLGKVPAFSIVTQHAAGDVRQARNAWAHCAFGDWDTVQFRQSFDVMEQLVKALALPAADETKLLADLNDWETKGTHSLHITIISQPCPISMFLKFVFLSGGWGKKRNEIINVTYW